VRGAIFLRLRSVSKHTIRKSQTVKTSCVMETERDQGHLGSLLWRRAQTIPLEKRVRGVFEGKMKGLKQDGLTTLLGVGEG